MAHSPTRITRTQSDGDQLLYFTSQSLSSDDRQLVFIGTVGGNPNLFVQDLANGLTRQLTHNQAGWLKSYVYFDGHPYQGFGKASVSLDSPRGLVYFIQGHEIRRVDLEGRQTTLAQLPGDEMTAFTHVSGDGRWLCVPTTDARTLEGDFPDNKPAYDIDARVQAENLKSYLNIYDTANGQLAAREVVERGWITHVQFSPADARLVLYNHEWPSDCGIRRMWLWDGQSHRRLRPFGPADWVCHEMWTRDGSAIIYHGGYKDGPCYVGRCDFRSGQLDEVPFDRAFTRYGHFTVGNGAWLVTDGYYQQPDDPPPPGWGGQWLALLRPDWSGRTIDWRPIARHGSSWDSQDSHPHPIFNHAGDAIYFTSDAQGKRAVYRAQAPC
jgi:Tol biopolymer transport system component